MAQFLISDGVYQAAKAVFFGGLEDGQQWWENLPISGMEHPLKLLALDLFRIVAHAAEIERLFSDLVNIQGKKRTWMSEQTMKIHGRLRGNYNQLRDGGILKRRKHAHMHTRDGAVIDVDAVREMEGDIETEGETEIAEDSMYVLDRLDRAFKALHISRAEMEEGWWEERSEQELAYTDRVRRAGARVSQCYNLQELDNVLAKVAPRSEDAEMAVDHRPADRLGWSAQDILRSKGL